MSKKKTNQTEQEFYENPEILAEKLSKTEAFLEKNKGALFAIVGAIVLVVGGYIFYDQSQGSKNIEAQDEIFQAVYYYEAEDFDKALNGDGNSLGFLDIIDEYGSTKTGNLANFYVGNCFLKKGEFETAIEYLNDFSSSDVLLQARAYALVGDANMELKNFSEAASYYKKAAEYKSNEQFSPLYWSKAGIAYEKLNDNKSAADCYDKIVTKYVKSPQYAEARKQLAKVKGLIKG